MMIPKLFGDIEIDKRMNIIKPGTVHTSQFQYFGGECRRVSSSEPHGCPQASSNNPWEMDSLETMMLPQ